MSIVKLPRPQRRGSRHQCQRVLERCRFRLIPTQSISQRLRWQKKGRIPSLKRKWQAGNIVSEPEVTGIFLPRVRDCVGVFTLAQ
jgi:hypothetical protein